MIVFGADVLEKAGRKHADLRKSLGAWLKVVESSDWKSLADMRKTYPSADAVKENYVFNLKGNRYRLVATINFEARHMFVDHVLTHADYSRGKWK